MPDTATNDVLALGHAIVDVLATVPDAIIDDLGLTKGTMALTDDTAAESIYAAMGPAVEVSGGSAANTAAGVASFGRPVAFAGTVADDQLGRVFTHDIVAAGVRYEVAPITGAGATGRCLVLVTSDGERTMNTSLGAGVGLSAGHLDEALVAASAVTYAEGYLFDSASAVGAIRRAIEVAHANGRLVALSLSDPFCVGRHRDRFLALLDGSVDVLFANEDELRALSGADDLDAAVAQLAPRCAVVAATRGAAGCLLAGGGTTVAVPATPVEHVVDTTGAGDLFAAGVLVGLVAGADLGTCGALGALAAGEVISHVGARPQEALADLATRAGLL